MKKIIFISLLFLMFVNLSACSSIENDITRQVDDIENRMGEVINSGSETDSGFQLVTVTSVTDGDTIEAIVESSNEKNTDSPSLINTTIKIRLIGVNTPESTNRQETYGKEASNYTKSMLEGKQVYLQKDVSDKDQYDRYLRIVWLEKPVNPMDETEIRTKMFNAILVLNGYAEPYTYEPDTTYSDYFNKFAIEAREQGLGLWAYGENGTTRGDLDN